MSSFPGSPRLLKGGIVLLDPTTGVVQRIITLQYNPDTLTRSLQIQAAETGDQISEFIEPPLLVITATSPTAVRSWHCQSR